MSKQHIADPLNKLAPTKIVVIDKGALQNGPEYIYENNAKVISNLRIHQRPNLM
jgi:hypothetical protein